MGTNNKGFGGASRLSNQAMMSRRQFAWSTLPLWVDAVENKPL